MLCDSMKQYSSNKHHYHTLITCHFPSYFRRRRMVIVTSLIPVIILYYITISSVRVTDNTTGIHLVSATTTTPSSGYANRNPFTILDISPSASDKEIKRKYYQLCLKYHPDKLQQLSKTQRHNYEQMFKDIQWAYSEISSGNCRNDTLFPFHFASQYQRRSSSPSGNDSGRGTASWNDVYRSQFAQYYHNYNKRQQHTRHRNFRFGNTHRGMSSNTFPFFNSKLWSSSTPSTMTNHGPKFLFRHHVTIPLSDLYMGQSHYQFTLSSHWNHDITARTMAAFRGGMGPYILYQSFLYAVPILRFSKIISIATVMYMFHQQLSMIPSLETINEYLVADILPGYKGTTKLIFTSDIIQIPNVEVHIILQEGKHPLYHREKNDLYVTCTISKQQAEKGCTIQLPSLRSNEMNIKVTRPSRNQTTPMTEDQESLHTILLIHVPPNTVAGDVIHVVGKGWPIRSKGRPSPPPSPKKNALSYGDLFVTVHVKSEKSRPKWYKVLLTRQPSSVPS